MGHRHYFRTRRSVVGSGNATDDVEFDPGQTGREYHIDGLAVEDETTAVATEVRVIVTGAGYDHPELEQPTPAAGTLYWLEGRTIHLTEGQKLVARFTGATADDILRMFISGWWEEVRKGG